MGLSQPVSHSVACTARSGAKRIFAMRGSYATGISNVTHDNAHCSPPAELTVTRVSDARVESVGSCAQKCQSLHCDRRLVAFAPVPSGYLCKEEATSHVLRVVPGMISDQPGSDKRPAAAWQHAHTLKHECLQEAKTDVTREQMVTLSEAQPLTL